MQGTNPATQQRAADVVEFIQRWRTWPRNGNPAAAYRAAVRAIVANPSIQKYELAKVAIRAARHPEEER